MKKHRTYNKNLPDGAIPAFVFRRSLYAMLQSEGEHVIYRHGKPAARVTIQKLPNLGKTTTEKLQTLEDVNTRGEHHE